MNEHGYSFEDAYGKLLGTIMLCSIIPTVLSFFPIRLIRKIFPPIVCGVVIMLIGVHLIAAGFKVGACLSVGYSEERACSGFRSPWVRVPGPAWHSLWSHARRFPPFCECSDTAQPL